MKAEPQEIHDALQVEQGKFQTLSEQLPLGVIMIAPDGGVKYINLKFMEMFGYALEDIPDGKTWFRKAYPDPEYRRKVAATWVEHYKGSKPGEKEPRIFTVVCKDGKQKIIHFIPVALETGEFLTTCEDITALKEAEEALRESENKFRDLSEKSLVGIYLVQDGFFKYVNLRLAEIHGYRIEEIVDKIRPQDLVLPEDWPLFEEAPNTGLTGEARSGSYRFRALTKDRRIIFVEIFSSITIYKAKPAIIGTLIDITEKVLIQEELQKAKEQAEYSNRSKSGFLANMSHPDVPAWLLGDPGRLKQILVNLTGNAVKFTEKGEVVINVFSEKETDQQVFIRCEVKDTGIGISPDRRSLLFKSFSQVDASTTRKYGGTGLGLAILKQLTEIMGGEIGVESTEGRGSIFRFTAAFKKPSERKEEALPQNHEIKGQRTLIMVDSETNRNIIGVYLKSFG